MLRFKQYTELRVLLEDKLNDFVGFASDHLQIKNTPKIDLVQQRDDTMTTASYSPGDNKIKVYAKNRAFFDVARSIAHELAHHSQNENGQELDGETGSDCENHANAVAGKIIRLYGQKNPDFYE